ncbi:MAG: SDR family NAD(P)-dependent oxidoreductase, partial [Polymorphobacter sp.]
MPVIVMTGATTGIGAEAAKRLLAPGTRLIVGSRGAPVPGAEMLPLDLANLASVRGFAGAVVAALAGAKIDALLLNAGGQRPDVSARSVDGFELTFATNHLAHYLLARLLLPHLAAGARVVLTSSGTHDPAEKTGVPPPRHADAGWLAHPETDPQCDASATTAGMRAYCASKLCNLLTARHIAALPEARAGGWIVTAYDPGLTPGTGLVRSQIWPVRALVAGFTNGMVGYV